MSVLAVKPPGRRTLERQGMTPEEELALLIREQEADDTSYASRAPEVLSLDAPAANSVSALSEFVGTDENGEVVCFVRPSVSPLAAAQQIPHGYGGYTKYRCRCKTCSAANNAYRRARRDGGKS